MIRTDVRPQAAVGPVDMAEVAVVGAGMGGLAVAARLAAQGHTVTVFERAATHGGQVAWYERDGFAFDLGPAQLSLPAVYRDLFARTGAPLESCVDLVTPGPFTRFRFADKTEIEVGNVGRGTLTRTLDTALGAGTGAQWNRFLDRAADIWEVTWRPLLEDPLDSFTGLVRQALKARRGGAPRPWRSLRGLVRRHLHDEHLRQYAERFATADGADPRTAPASMAVLPYIEHTFGVAHVRGGMRRLADALHARCVELGVGFRFGAEVRAVRESGGKAAGVQLADGSWAADIVVSDVDARSLYGALFEASSAAAQVRRLVPSPGVFTLLLALQGADGPTGPGGTQRLVLLGPEGDGELDVLFPRSRRLTGPVAAPTITVHAPADDTTAPPGGFAAWRVSVDAPRHSADGQPGTLDWDAPGLAEEYADTVLAELADRGIEVRDRLVWREIRTPADAERAHAVPGGSAHGLATAGGRSLVSRPTNAAPLPGLFLVGGTVHPETGLPGVGMSAAVVARLIGPA